MATKKKSAATQSNSPTQQRLWLMYPPKLIKKPFIWEIGHKFKVVTNIRQASVTDEIGIVCLELDGARSEDCGLSTLRWANAPDGAGIGNGEKADTN